jgi:hypothetical protein
VARGQWLGKRKRKSGEFKSGEFKSVKNKWCSGAVNSVQVQNIGNGSGSEHR